MDHYNKYINNNKKKKYLYTYTQRICPYEIVRDKLMTSQISSFSK